VVESIAGILGGVDSVLRRSVLNPDLLSTGVSPLSKVSLTMASASIEAGF